jgi:peroxiredoxin (alkyl hydroperoxide reductase subunit C)
MGETAPSFKAESTNGEINFPEDYGKSWKILFSHPQDFTPVCTTELIELAKLEDKFDKMNVKVLAISTDKLSTQQQ